MFQYRKRYEVTCDIMIICRDHLEFVLFQYRKRYEVTCDQEVYFLLFYQELRFNTASGMRSHVTLVSHPCQFLLLACFNTASGMRSHVTTNLPYSKFDKR